MNDLELLIQAARTARKHAYAPYSNFKVGAAVETKSGEIFSGCNMENASYGLTVCAERNALSAMIAAGNKSVKSIAITSENGIPPCGACRQVIWEICGEIPVYLVDEAGNITATTSTELLPGAFSKEMLT